jgi:lysophospholipase L1-like esterase
MAGSIQQSQIIVYQKFLKLKIVKTEIMKKRKFFSVLLILVFSGSIALFAQNKSTEPTNEQKEAWKKAQEELVHNDWANLGRFRDNNKQIGMPATGEKRIVFMGNSITEGWSRLDSAFFSGKPYINRGISGQTTPQMLIRFKPDVVNLKASVVVILAGINDIAGNTGPSTLEMIEDNLSSMVEIGQANGIKVVLSSVLPAYDFPWRPGMEPAEKVVKLNSWIKKYAETHGCIYLDYFTTMSDEKHALKAEYTKDGVHPNLAGYKIMEPLAEKAIKEALGSK